MEQINFSSSDIELVILVIAVVLCWYFGNNAGKSFYESLTEEDDEQDDYDQGEGHNHET